MKKGYICKCNKCGFITTEKNELCPICDTQMDMIDGTGNNLNPSLPNKLDHYKHENTEIGYYCYKCRKGNC